MPPPSWVGQTIGGRYKIESLLGQGGMSAVYKGTDPNLRRAVAIKLIHSHLATDREFVRRFEEEAAAVAQMRHPNIIQVYDFNHDGGTYFMVLEFVPGESLFDRLTKLHGHGQRLPLSETARLLTSICDAVQYAHDRNIIHRDLKPANVMINTSGQPILMDFGIAKIVGGAKNTATGALVGTPSYISPEQVRGQTPDQRADIYALGIMMYEMLAGRVPFDAESTLAIMLMHINEPVPDIRQLNRDLPDGLVAVVEKALAKDPNDRIQTARDMARALRPYLPQKSVTLPPGALMAKSEATKSEVTGATPRNTIPPTDRRTAYEAAPYSAPAPRSNLWPILIGLAAVLVVGVLAVGVLALVIGSQFIGRLTPTEVVAVTQSTPQLTTQLTQGPTSPGVASSTPVLVATTAPILPSATVSQPTATVAPTAIPVPQGMSLIPAGFFNMGANDKADEQPIHPVLLDAFYVDTTEVTNAMYRACVQASNCTAASSSSVNTSTFDNYPVFGVNWNQAQAFCQAQGKRLPTEAEWEYGAAGPDSLMFPWGNAFDPNLSAASAQNVQPVGSYPKGASPFGLLDMAGNVSEWVADVYSANFYASAAPHNPVNVGGNEHIYRGGGYDTLDPSVYTNFRRWHKPASFSDVDIGFRCAKDAPEVNAATPPADHKTLVDKFCAVYDKYKPGAACP